MKNRTWDMKGSASNSSVLFEAMRKRLGQIIRNDAHMLLAGGADNTAGLILAQLTHKYGFAPVDEVELERLLKEDGLLDDLDNFPI